MNAVRIAGALLELEILRQGVAIERELLARRGVLSQGRPEWLRPQPHTLCHAGSSPAPATKCAASVSGLSESPPLAGSSAGAAFDLRRSNPNAGIVQAFPRGRWS
jgi:hypothetical protein